MAPKKKAKAPASPPTYVRDEDAIQAVATTAEDRRAVLTWALANVWANEDIDRIQRIDEDDQHGWAMWPLQ